MDTNLAAIYRKSLKRFTKIYTSGVISSSASNGAIQRSARRQMLRATCRCEAAFPPDYA